MYIDAVNQTMSQCSGAAAATDTASPDVIIGGSGYKGMIADVQVYNTSLSPSQINTLFKEGVAGFPLDIPNVAGWWPLDGDPNDYSSNGNNGVFASPAYASGEQGYSGPLSSQLTYSNGGFGNIYNGYTSYIGAGSNSLGTTAGGSVTISAWVEPVAMTQNSYIVEQEPLDSNWQLYLHNGYVYLSGGSGAAYAATSSLLPTEAWTYVTGVIQGSSGSIYIDGLNVSSAAVTQIGSSAGSIEIGRSLSGGYFNGSIANLQIYNTALDANQIYQLYNNQLPKAASAVVPMGGWSP